MDADQFKAAMEGGKTFGDIEKIAADKKKKREEADKREELKNSEADRKPKDSEKEERYTPPDDTVKH
jgi:hypothetical protein